MKNIKELNKVITWEEDCEFKNVRMKTTHVDFPTGVRGQVIVGFDEDGWEHVSVKLQVDRLPKWSEMCYLKDLFWKKEEEVVQIHPKKSRYVNITEALHLWRPVNGDWSLLNHE